MVNILSQSYGPVIVIEANGKVTSNDYKTLLRPLFIKTIKQYGRLRLLFLADGFTGWSGIGSLLSDGLTMLFVRRYLERVACVCGPGWKQNMTKISSPFIKGKARAFNTGQEDLAWQWIFEGIKVYHCTT